MILTNTYSFSKRREMSTQSLPAISLRTGHHLPAAQLSLWVVNYLIHRVLWPIRSAIFGVGSRRLPALREAPAQLMPRSLAAVPPRTAMRSSSLKPGIGRPFPRTRALQPEEEPRCRPAADPLQVRRNRHISDNHKSQDPQMGEPSEYGSTLGCPVALGADRVARVANRLATNRERSPPANR